MPKTVTVKNPYGQLGTIEESHLQEALKRGFTVPENEEIQAHNDEQEYGSGMLNPAVALGEEALGTATFGASRWLENKLGVTTPEAQAARAKYNPVASTLGVPAGVVTDPFGALGAVSKGAKGVTKAAEAVVGTAPATAGIAAQIARSAPAAALGSAVEGAAYGLGQSVTEHALGDPDLNAEKVMSNVGYGALLGGGLGAAVSAGEIGVPAIVGKAKETAANIGEKLGNIAKENYIGTSSFISGKPEDVIREGLEGRASFIDNPQLQEAQARDFADSLQDHLNKMEDASKRANAQIRPEEMYQTLSGMAPEQAMQNALPVTQKLEQAISEMEAHPALYPSHAVAKLSGLRDEFTKDLSAAKSSGEVYSAINDLKGNIDKQGRIFGKAISPEFSDAANLIKGLRADVKNNLENEMVWGQAAARQSAFNEAQSNFIYNSGKGSEFQKSFLVPVKTRTGSTSFKVSPAKVRSYLNQVKDARGAAKTEALQSFIDASKGYVDQIESTYKSVPSRTFDRAAIDRVLNKNLESAQNTVAQAELKKTLGMLGGGAHNTYLGEGAALGVGAFHPAIGTAIEAFNMARNPGLAIQRLAKLEKLANKTGEYVSKAAKAIFKKGSQVARESSGLVGSKLVPDQVLDSAAQKDKKKDAIARIEELNANPEKLMDKLVASTESTSEHAPEISGGIQAAAARATSFLASKVPERPQTGPFSPKAEFSKAEVMRFERYHDAVDNPVGVMGQIADGSLSPEAVEAVQTVYPKLYQEMTMAIMDEATSFKGSGGVPYKTKLGLSLFLGQDLDSSLAQPSIMSNQVAISASNMAQPQGPVKAPQSGLQKLDRADSQLTASQASAQRKDA